GFNLAIARLSIGHERINQFTCRGSDFFHRSIERSLVRLRRLVEARELSDELKRRRPDLVVSCGRVEVKQGVDVATQGLSFQVWGGGCYGLHRLEVVAA